MDLTGSKKINEKKKSRIFFLHVINSRLSKVKVTMSRQRFHIIFNRNTVRGVIHVDSFPLSLFFLPLLGNIAAALEKFRVAICKCARHLPLPPGSSRDDSAVTYSRQVLFCTHERSAKVRALVAECIMHARTLLHSLFVTDVARARPSFAREISRLIRRRIIRDTRKGEIPR